MDTSLYQPVTTTVSLRGQAVKIHAISTGTVAVKRNFRTKKGFGELAKLNILLDPHYTEYLPIWVWVIEHPEGLILIDTGEIQASMDLDQHLAKENAFLRYTFKHAAKFQVRAEEELDRQFDRIGLKPTDVQRVVLTHMHLDHSDGLRFFPKQEVIVGSHEFRHPNSPMASTYPSGFKPHVVEYQSNQIEVFDRAYSLTAAGDLLYIPTPGHTRGHSSVLFKTDAFDILFAGDISYNQGQVLRNEHAGVQQDFRLAQQTYNNVRSYAAQHKTIYLPSHDGEAGERLSKHAFMIP